MKEQIKVGIIRISIIILAVIFVIGSLFVSRYYLDHRLDRIEFNGRSYLLSGNQYEGNMFEIHKKYLEGSHATGVFTKGMEVYRYGDGTNTPTVLYLRKKDGTFLIYGLSGGP